MIDTHTHIFDPVFDNDLEMVVARALAFGVERMILPSIDSQSHERLISTVQKFPELLYGAIGLHPTSVNDNPEWRAELALVERYLAEKPLNWVAIGEIGLDLYWSRDFLAEQIEAFTHQIELAIDHNLPVIVHTRDAWDEMMQAIAPYKESMQGVLHSFSGQQHHAQEVIESTTLYIGIGGALTYKNSTLPKVLAHVPLDRILLETDSPYLPPVPHRGERNESSNLELIAAKLADIKNMSLEEVKKITTNNAMKLFFAQPATLL